jgi:hypothetical protein
MHVFLEEALVFNESRGFAKQQLAHAYLSR